MADRRIHYYTPVTPKLIYVKEFLSAALIGSNPKLSILMC